MVRYLPVFSFALVYSNTHKKEVKTRIGTYNYQKIVKSYQLYTKNMNKIHLSDLQGKKVLDAKEEIGKRYVKLHEDRQWYEVIDDRGVLEEHKPVRGDEEETLALTTLRKDMICDAMKRDGQIFILWTDDKWYLLKDDSNLNDTRAENVMDYIQRVMTDYDEK